MRQNTIASGIIDASDAIWIPPTSTFANPPTSPEPGCICLFTDAITAGAATGGGTALSTCRWSGTKWEPVSGGGGNVTSVFGRQGAIVAASGDYVAAQVTNAVSVLGSYANPSWITSLAWNKITGAPAAVGQTPWLSDIDGAGFILRNVGNIGINTAGPAAKLGIDTPYAAAAQAMRLSCNLINAGDYQEILFSETQGASSIGASIRHVRYATADYGGSIAFACAVNAAPGNLIERMRITAAGNVGINCQPWNIAALDVAGVAGADMVTVFRAPSGRAVFFEMGGTNWVEMQVDASGNFFQSFYGLVGGVFQSYRSGAVASTLVLKAGNVGIGTASPVCTFDVAGWVRSTAIGTSPASGKGVNFFYHGPNDFGTLHAYDYTLSVYKKMVVDGAPLQLCGSFGAGNVAIGTLTPAYKLDVLGDVNCSGAFRVNGVPKLAQLEDALREINVRLNKLEKS